MTLPAAEYIGPYRIIEQIGAGGMATVYRANHERLDREVAIKVMHQSFMQDQTFLARFEREARIVGSLEHPNIVPVYDYDEYKGQPYLVLKYIEGQTLKQRFIKQPLNLDEILTMMDQVAAALTYAHERGVLHRDVKPSNIIIDRNDAPHLTDFGLARMAQSGESTMSADMMLGTPQYISPEQARGDSDLDARTDVYSFGIILYELVTGAVPFSGETTYAIVHKQIYAAPPRPTQLNPDVPVAVERVLLRALDKDRTRRHDSPNALMQAFAHAVKTSGLDALDEDRASLARAAAGEISAHTPRGGRYVSIPAPGPAPQMPISDSRAERINVTVQEIGDRLKQASQDVWRDIRKKETFRRIIDSLKTSIRVGPMDDSSSVAATGDAVQSGRASVQVIRAGKPHPVRKQPKQPKGRRIVAVTNDITRDWSLDEDMVRRRIAQRRERRNGFLLHVVFYLLAVGGMAASYNAVHTGLAEFLVSPEVVADVGGEFLAPLANLEYPLIFALLWGGFIIAHGLNTFYNTGGRLIRRRQSLLNALDAQHGRDWQNTINQREYRRVRRRVNNRYNRRLRFMMHAFTGFMITAAVFAAWPPLHDTLIGMSLQDDFIRMMIDQPIPYIVALFMSLTVLAHGIFSFIVGIIDNGSREKSYRRELDRERELASLAQPVQPKRKVDDLLLDDEKPKHGLRLNEEGEFTDSLAAELNDDGWQRDTTSRD